jgi:hypothetical protein
MAPRPRTRTVNTKVSEDDHAILAQFAGDQKVGEWLRDVLFQGRPLRIRVVPASLTVVVTPWSGPALPSAAIPLNH